MTMKKKPVSSGVAFMALPAIVAVAVALVTHILVVRQIIKTMKTMERRLDEIENDIYDAPPKEL